LNSNMWGGEHWFSPPKLILVNNSLVNSLSYFIFKLLFEELRIFSNGYIYCI
jgi:hypothetical protein